MQDEELRLLVIRDADASRRSRQFKTVLVFGTLLGLLLASAAGWSAQRKNYESEGAEEVPKASGAKYRGLLEAAPDAMVVVNHRGEITLLNWQAEKQFGYHRDELVGQKVKNIIPEGFAERLVADGTRSAAEALAQQIGTGIDLIARRKDGTEFPIELMLSPLESAEDVLVTAASRNITTCKLAEAHLLYEAQGYYFSRPVLPEKFAKCSRPEYANQSSTERGAGIGAVGLPDPFGCTSRM
jgi:PAS domain S-box-containing protein